MKQQINTDKKLVIAGGASHSDEYYNKICAMCAGDDSIIMTGFVQGQELQELYSNAYLYVLPSDIEGMPMSLLEAMSYGNVYVAQVSMGANDSQVIKAMNEAEAYNGPSIIIAYSHCIAQGFNLADGLMHQKEAVDTGSWPLYRYNPENIKEGKAPLMLDSKAPSKPLSDYMSSETRFQVVKKANPERYDMLLNKAQENVNEKRALLEHMSEYK